MKNLPLLFVSLVLLTAAAVVAMAILSDQSGGDTLGPKTEAKMKQDYLESHTWQFQADATIDDVFVQNYYGTYGDCAVVIIYDGFSAYLTVITSETIDGITITTSDSNTIRAWKNGEFYSLQDAYDLGFLTKSDLKKISEKHKAAHPFLYES